MNKTKTHKKPPVIVIMGHVDHGKTTLLDYIRKANVVGAENGGITQAIGAYEILHNEQRLTFIDTPGHQAFNRMRERGASIADIAILIVAADDGVNTQTKEAIEILQKAEIPFIVAINKIDKNNANVEQTKASLAKSRVLLEGYGGDISFQEISAKTGQGIDELLDLIVLASEVEEFFYDPTLPGEGYILEAEKNSFTGVTATIIITNGTVHKGDFLKTKTSQGKIKRLQDPTGKEINNLEPSAPALLLGFENIPQVGEEFKIVPSIDSKNSSKVEQLDVKKLKETDKSVMKFIVKADTGGSLEAAVAIISNIKPPEDAEIAVIQQGVGDISDGDAKLAISTGAYLAGFNVKTSSGAKTLIRARELKVFQSDIIYKLVEEIENQFKQRNKEVIVGDLDVLAVFSQENPNAQIIGGKVLVGEMKNNSEVDISRRGKVLGSGTITSLQCQKKDADEVSADNECGIRFNSDHLIKKGDHLLRRPV